MKDKPQETDVHESLDNAVANGYELDDWSAAEIADDLHDYDSQFEDFEPEDLLPAITSWKEKRSNRHN